MTKKARVTRAPRELTRKQISRLDRERRVERALLIGVIAVAAVVVGVLATGLIVEKVVKARAAVAVVNGTPVRTVDFQARVRFDRMQLTQQLAQLQEQRQSIDTTQEGSDFLLQYIDGQIAQLQQQLGAANVLTIGSEALDQLVLYELARQEAQRRDITVSDAVVQRELELSFGYDRVAPTPALTQTDVLSPSAQATVEPTPMTEAAFQERFDLVFKQLFKPNEITERQYRTWFKGDLLVDKLRAAMADELPVQQEQVQLKLLSVQDQQVAQTLAARLDAGDTMDTFSAEFEAAEQAPGYVTELDWYPRSLLEENLGAELTELAFSLPVGGHSGAAPSPDGASTYIIEVLGHEVRDLDGALRDELGSRSFDEWFKLQKETGVEYRDYSDRVPAEP